MLIYIEPYVYVNTVEKGTMYYNTINSDFLVVNANAIKLGLLPNNTNRSVIVNSKDFLEIKEVVDELRGKYIMDYLEEEQCEKLPFITAPEINFSTGVSFQDFIEKRTIQDSISQICELNLFINNSCDKECEYCQKAFKQFDFCTRGSVNKILKFDKVKSIIGQFENIAKFRVNLMGANIFLHPQILDILKYLNTTKISYSIFVHYLNLDNLYPFIEKIKGEINVLISSDSDESILRNLINSSNKQINFNCIVSSESEYEISEKLSEGIKKEFTYTPFYNGDNINFFKENVFLDESDIKNISIEYKEMLINELINKNHYGHLFIDSNGDVRGGINDIPIGNIYKKELGEMIKEKFEDIESWFVKRKEIMDCNQCFYNVICPPISNYEKNIGRNNICNINLKNE